MTQTLTSTLLREELSRISAVSPGTAAQLLEHTSLRHLSRGDLPEQEGDPVRWEYIVLRGILRAFVRSPEGEEATVNFYPDHQPVTPALMRSVGGACFLNLEVISTDAELLMFSYPGMTRQMQGNEDLKRFGYQVMMQDAFARAERERMLLTAPGREKLQWFRQRFPNLENRIPHYHIASYLGLTPTSMSRLRAQQHG
jgi:CRP-like cAMP-binding protein